MLSCLLSRPISSAGASALPRLTAKVGRA